jgi:isopentenyl-diphosphate delta-isomerase
MDDEAFEVFAVDGSSLGLVPRSRVHREGFWHRAASVLLFRSDGRLVIQRRQWTKDVCPGLWDLSVAEHLKPGESYEQGAVRGLREELGVEGVALEPLGAMVRAKLDLPEHGVRDYELQQSFRGVFDGELRLDFAEVCEIDAITLLDLGSAFVVRPNDFTPWFRASATRLGLCKNPSMS